MSPYRYPAFRRLASFLFTALLCLRGSAGGGPLNTVVLVNQQDPESLELGAYYAAARGIPQRNIVRVSISKTPDLAPAAFTNQVVQPLLDHLAAADVEGQIDFAAVAWRQPYRTAGGALSNQFNSITAALLYGVKSAPYPTPCNLTAAALSPVHEADISFATLRPSLPGRPFAATLLTGLTLASAKLLVDRSVAADFTHPGGDVYLLHTSDIARNVQWPQFDDAAMAMRMTPAPLSVIQADQDKLGNTADVAGYFAGLPNHRPEVETNSYTPGALGNHLTSFGGRIHDSIGQMSILRWIETGSVGAAGTVDEACNFTNKFPSARVHLHHARGYALAESFLQSIQHPYQTLVVGDPLCQPYATPPVVVISGVTNQQVVAGTVVLNLSGSSPLPGVRIGRMELYADGRRIATPFQKGPTPGNRVTAVVDGTSRDYTVAPGDTLRDVVEGLAGPVGSLAGFDSTSRGDHVEVRQSGTGLAGAGLTLTANATQHVGAELTLSAGAVFPAFLESDQHAREQLDVSGTPTIGDTIRTVITLAGGTKVTNTVTAVLGSTPGTLLNALAAAINAEPALQAPGGCTMKYVVAPVSTYAAAWLVANTLGYPGAQLHVAYTITSPTLSPASNFTDVFNDNATATVARNAVWLSAGGAPLAGVHNLDTTALPDGPHVLTAVAIEGTAVETQGSTSIAVVVDNHPGGVSILYPESGSFVVEGKVVTVAVNASRPAGLIATNLLVRGVAQPELTVDTDDYGAGMIELQAIVTDGLGRETVSAPVLLTVLADYDEDGLPDAWERTNFGSIGAHDADNDPDIDGQDNLFEFVADTQPTNAASRLTLEIDDTPSTPLFQLVFPGSPNRRYTIEQTPGAALPSPGWIAVPPERFAGTNVVHRWTPPPEIQDPPAGRAAFRLSVDLP